MKVAMLPAVDKLPARLELGNSFERGVPPDARRQLSQSLPGLAIFSSQGADDACFRPSLLRVPGVLGDLEVGDGCAVLVFSRCGSQKYLCISGFCAYFGKRICCLSTSYAAKLWKRVPICVKRRLYKEYLIQKDFEKYNEWFDYQFKGFRVLVIMNNKQRIQRLRKELTNKEIKKFIWFAEKLEVTPETIFKNIWMMSDIDDEKKYSILGG
jgi:hypothetical protein